MQENLEVKNKKIDIDQFTLSEADDLSEKLGSRVREICDRAAKKANKILNMYGMKAIMAIQITGLDKDETSDNLKFKKRKSKINTNTIKG